MKRRRELVIPEPIKPRPKEPEPKNVLPKWVDLEAAAFGKRPNRKSRTKTRQ